jgi:hypothetical protein
MKKMLFVLLVVLAFSASAFAPPPLAPTALIYNLKEKYVESENYGGGWELWTCSCKGYVVVEIDGDTAYVEFIETWTEGKDKYGYTWSEKSDVLTQVIGKKTMLIVSEGDEAFRILLTGEVKPTKIGTAKPDIAKKLSGNYIENEVDYVYSAAVSVSLNTKMTIQAYEAGQYTAEDAKDWIVGILKDQGYNFP